MFDKIQHIGYLTSDLDVAIAWFERSFGAVNAGGGPLSPSYAVPSGGRNASLRMAITLGAFIAGSVIGTAHLPWWLDQPRLPALSIPNSLGWPAGLAVQLAAIGFLVLGALYLERRRHGAHEPLVWGAGGDWRERLLHGGWPLAWGALALALLNIATLLIAAIRGASPGASRSGAPRWPMPWASASPTGPSGSGRARHESSKPGSNKTPCP